MAIQIRNEEMSSIMSVDGFKYGLWTDVIAGFQALPGLVGFWPMSSVQRSTGNVYDLSGQGRTLTRNGPSYYYQNMYPYFNFNGTTDYLSRADETDLDIIGNESHISASMAGLTMGGWFYFKSIPATEAAVFSKMGAAGQYSYEIFTDSSTLIRFGISNNGTALIRVSSTITGAIGSWYFLVGRFIPSTSLSIYVNGLWTNNTASIPATIFNSNSALNIGRRDSGSAYSSIYSTLCFLCASSLSDSIINGIYQRSRLLFGV